MELWDIYDKNRTKTDRQHERGLSLQPGDYHIVVNIWIQNSKGEYLITKRTPNKEWPLFWECTGGSAVTGDTSLEAAMREVREETGLTLDSQNGQMLLSIRRDDHFFDVWYFQQDFNISQVVLQEGETCDAKWATEQEIRDLIKGEKFVPVNEYVDELFGLISLCKAKGYM